jgi:murein DD-endopeptidase MepM/ murein hydrolase activator NlpD
VIDHGFGTRTTYGHTRESFVAPGDLVRRGMRIASVGNSGRSTGPHLHYGVSVEGEHVDPRDYILE